MSDHIDLINRKELFYTLHTYCVICLYCIREVYMRPEKYKTRLTYKYYFIALFLVVLYFAQGVKADPLEKTNIPKTIELTE